MKKETIIGIIAGIALILSIVGLVGGNHQTAPGLGGTTNYDTISVNGFKLGTGCNDSFSTSCTGTSLSQILTGTVTCATGASNITALASSTYDCAISNVLAGDKVFASLPTSTPNSIMLVGATASTTVSGIMELVLANISTSTRPVAGATSSVQYLIIR